ncbi:MAG: Flp pilus assembly protein CpaB, partial [Oxalobacteraceae bacterium]|nr:Flp pilus assembly protein CpaB [Oxalobacteraceae bacterium]
RWLDAKSGSGMTKVAVVSTDISLGQRLTPELVQLVDWPSRSVPPGAFQQIDTLDGRVLKTNMLRGEPVLQAKLAPIGTQGGLSAVIGEGRRAITVRVNDVIGVAGFALPGNYVDIIVNTQRDSNEATARDKSISKIVLERILVLAVAQEVGRDDTKPRVVNAVTLEVTPQQAEKIDLARSVGTLSLVLRNQIDPLVADTAGVTKNSLLGQDTTRDMPDEKSKNTSSMSTPVSRSSQTASTSKKKSSAAPIIRASSSAPQPKETSTVSAAPLTCVGVIIGLRNGQECY